MKNHIFHLALLVLTIIWNASAHKQKICVIGAGVSGLASVKRLSEHTDEFEPIVFEKNSDVGGSWIYTDSTTVDEHGLPVHSSMYKNLRTNLPKELMAWPDYRDFNDERSFVSHETVLQYLRNYTAHFNLSQYVEQQFRPSWNICSKKAETVALNTLVEHVAAVDPRDKNWDRTKWLVRTRNLNTQERKETICNAVMICNGHYAKPNIPIIPGIEKFRGPIIHSHIYRKPELFANKTVAVLGAAVSGVDISMDLSKHAKKIYLSHRHEKITSELPKNIEQVPGIIEAKNNELILSNGSSVIADAFIYCTGYLYDFPFLDKSCGINVEKAHVFPLYNQMINAEHPSMAVIGHPTAFGFYIIPYVQSQYFVALLQGKVQLPSYEEMMKNANTLPPGVPTGKYHRLGGYQWTYLDQLTKAGGFESLPSYYKGGLKLFKDYRDTHLATFKDARFILNPDGTFHLEITEKHSV